VTAHPAADAAMLACVDQYHGAIERHRAGDFTAAEERWRRLNPLRTHPDRGPYRPLRAALPADWDGVYVKTSQ
jgi:hypothetical protein